MPIFFDLPTDVTLSIIMDWLGDTKSLVALDSASARSIRWAYLGLVRDPRFLLANAINFCGKANDIRFWISIRGARIRGVVVSASELKEVIRVSYDCMAAVDCLTVSGTTEELYVGDFRMLLKLLPSLTSLDLSNFTTSTDNLLVVLSMMRHLRLRTLKLDNCSTSCEIISLLVHSFGGALEVLCLGTQRLVDAATLQILGAKCHNVKELRFTCGDMLSEVLASALGPEKFPLLEVVALKYRGDANQSPINDEVVLSLCSNHSNLECISAALGSRVTLSSVAVALTHCPRFREMNTTLFEFKTAATDAEDECEYELPERPFYKLIIRHPFATAAFQAITNAPFFKHKVRSFESSCSHNFSDEDVAEIIDAFGKHLYHLTIDLGDDVSHQTIERLFRECTELQYLYLENCANFTDDLVMMLAEQCPHVHSLSLAGAVNITNLSMCYLLQRMGQDLVNLYIEECQKLTNLTLIAISECCVSLEMLNITGAGITADAVITHVIKPNRLLKLVELAADTQSLKTLGDFVGEKMNGADRRWKHALDASN